MDNDDLRIKNYLEELYRQTGGDAAVQVSMYELGAAIGLDRAEAGSLAEELMVQGQVELKTLAGGISITPEGLEELGIADSAADSAGNSVKLGDGPIVDDGDRQTVQSLTEEIKKGLSGRSVEFDLLEEIVLDLKTLEVQLLSPRAKTAVLLAIFSSLQGSLEAAGMGLIAEKLKASIG